MLREAFSWLPYATDSALIENPSGVVRSGAAHVQQHGVALQFCWSGSIRIANSIVLASATI